MPLSATPSSNAMITGGAVIALGVFLNLLPFFPVPTTNQTIAIAVASGLLGFIGGTATGRANKATTETGDVNVTEQGK